MGTGWRAVDSGSFSWVLEVGRGVEPTSFSAMASVAGFPADPTASSANVSHNFVASWDTTALADGFYTLRLRVTDDLGNVGEDRLGLWVPALDSQAHAGQPQSPGASSEPVPGSALADLVRGALLAAGRLLVGAPDHG